jgi:fructokinase
VRDTVGAGDAFTAALVAGRLRFPEASWPRLLRAACALGAFVASRDGAQPDYGDFRLER